MYKNYAQMYKKNICTKILQVVIKYTKVKRKSKFILLVLFIHGQLTVRVISWWCPINPSVI